MLCTLALSGGAAVVAAIIATVVAGLGWLGKSILGGTLYYRTLWGEEIERLIALKAEISMNLKAQRNYADDALVSGLRARFAREKDFRHFIPLHRENAVFDNIKKDITRLPEAPLQGVVNYYKASGELDALLASFETERYETLATDRKIELYGQAVHLAKSVVGEGEKTLGGLDAAIERRDYQRVALTATVVVLAIVAIGSGVSATDRIFGLADCRPPATEVRQTRGGMIGGLMKSSPSLDWQPSDSYIDTWIEAIKDSDRRGTRAHATA